MTTGVLYVLMRRLSRTKHELEDLVAARTDALIDSEAQYRLLFDSNPLPMWVFDRKSLRFLAVNDAAVSHYGYSRDEFLRMTILDIQPSEGAAPGLNWFRSSRAGCGERRLQNIAQRMARIIEVEISSHSLNFRGAEAELILAHDITARRKGEQQLLQSQEKFAKAFRSSPFGITISSEAEGRYLDVNPDVPENHGICARRDCWADTCAELEIWADPEQRRVMIDQLKTQQHSSQCGRASGRARDSSG